MARQSRSGDAASWQGRWIWAPGVQIGGERNDYCYLRKTFDLPAEPVKAPVRLTADNRYQLFVNGKRICRGPARCVPWHQAYDEVDLAPHLRKGKNCLAVLALHFGVSTFQSVERGGLGFLLDGEVRCADGATVAVHTDTTWKAMRDTARRRDIARYTIQLGFQEDVDAALLPARWNQISFRDRAWPDAQVLGIAQTMPFEAFEPRGIPFSRESSMTFARLAGEFTGKNGNEYLRPDDLGALIADERYTRARSGSVRSPEAMLRRGREFTVVKSPGQGRFIALVLDAGRETAGYVNLDVEASGGEILDFFYTEHVRPDGTPVRRAHNGALASMADRYRCRKGRQRYQFHAWKGFRYLVVVFRRLTNPLKVHRIDGTFTSYPVERQGAFHCSDERLNRIWEVGAWTQQLCMHDAYVDCPWREQAQWWGDARIQWRVNMAVFGDHALFKRGIRQIAQSQAFHGLTYGLYPTDAHGLILPDYTLVWICSIWDYYMYSGDDGPMREHFERVVRALEWFEGHAGAKHLLSNAPLGMWLFLDWAPLFKAGHSATFTMQYLEALRVACRMADHLGRNGEKRRWEMLAGRVEKAIRRAFWDAEKKHFIEGRYADGRAYRQVAQHGNAYAILTGLQPRHQDAIADRIVWIARNYDRLAKDNVGGNHQHPRAHYPIASSFFYAYVLEALFRAGRHRDALQAIRSLWGRMLDDGATTWYESWSHSPQTHGDTSACHAWSASPTYHLSEQIGGVTPLEPGFRKVRIAPHAFDLRHADIRVPTPRGVISVKWERDDKRGLVTEIGLPKGIRAACTPFGSKTRHLAGGSHVIRTGP